MKSRISLIIVLLFGLAGGVMADEAKPLTEQGELYLKFTINTGARHYDKKIGQNLDGDSLDIFGLGLGIRYKRFTLNADFCINNDQDVTAEYTATTGWPRYLLKLNYYSYAIELGYIPIRYKRFDLNLYSGVQWVELTEGHSGIDFHPNFSNASGGELGFMFGGNINIRVNSHSFKGVDDRMIHYFFWGMRYVQLGFQNLEYGDGYTYEIRIGYKLELGI